MRSNGIGFNGPPEDIIVTDVYFQAGGYQVITWTAASGSPHQTTISPIEHRIKVGEHMRLWWKDNGIGLLLYFQINGGPILRPQY